MLYYQVTIEPSSGGGGEWDAGERDDDGWADDTDLLAAMADAGDEMVELGVDPLPDWAEDIRGRIHREPSRVFAFRRADGRVSYNGIVVWEKD